MDHGPKTIGITTGDPKGIGPIVVKKVLTFWKTPPHIHLKIFGPLESQPALTDTDAAKITAQSLHEAVQAVLENKIQLLINAPVNKKRLQLVIPHFKGHTEWLGEQFHAQPFTMFFTDTPQILRVALVTRHLSLQKMLQKLNAVAILQTIRSTDQVLQKIFGLPKPAIGVCGLNPHAGEEGLWGTEDRQMIYPAISQAQQEGIRCAGPLSPDTAFWQARRGDFDAIVALYHDQGLIPIKTLAFLDAVQITFGLPVLRLSVDHGTAEHLVDTPEKIDMTNFRRTLEWGVKLCKLNSAPMAGARF